ncbi:hypothetical protein AAFC00_000796 [Neodothiora populina]|uniref:AMP-activated protein kinase glycogen-binding domain-containing protein n=1 Tax=Neodothiora populina TaxID=2781224 RepID=A0ABR3PM21_9PEZI
MGSHTFKWPHYANEVFVTGTFDNWQKSVKLDKHGDVFQKTVDLPAEKTLYKFVVDGNWTTDTTAHQEQDDQGIYNNVLTADDIKTSPTSNAFFSSAAPASSTAAMAGEAPLERNSRESHLEPPGAFPETPANELQQFSVNPIPATHDAPVPGGEGSSNPVKLAAGEPVPETSSYTKNDIDTFASSTGPTSGKRQSVMDVAHDTEGTVMTNPAEDAQKALGGAPIPADEEEKAFGVNPLPATSGIGNPIKLAPGEPVPHPSTFTSNTVHSTVGDMKSDSGAPQLPPISPQTEREANGAGMFDLPALGSGPGPMIPESSLPMGAAALGAGGVGDASISSVAPQSTTAQLAGQVPIRERGVPEVVTESEKAAHESPEAAAYTEPVNQKSAVEDELKATIPEAAGVDGVGHGNAMGVPAAVTESQQRAHADPEAAASSTAVDEKSAMEEELKQKVPEEPATSSSGVFGSSERGVTGAIAGGAMAAGGALAAAAYAAKDKAQPALDQAAEYTSQYTGAGATSEKSVPETSSGSVPAAVVESQHSAHVDPEASAEPVVVSEKADMEAELKAKVPEEPATSESGLLGKSETGITGKAAAGVAAGTAAAGAAIAGGIYAARDKTSEATGIPKDTILPPTVASTLDSINNNKGTTAPTSGSGVPEEVVESQKAAHVSPEASANPEAVAEKSQMEKELLSEVKPSTATGAAGVAGVPEEVTESQRAAHVSPEASANPEAVAEKSQMERELLSEVQPSAGSFGGAAVPEEVKESQQAAHVSPEASANPEAVAEKSAMEKELLSEVKPHNEAGEPAPTAGAAALTTTAPGATTGESSLSSPDGLNAGANSQAQSLFTKTGELAHAEKVDADPTSFPTSGTDASGTGNLTESANQKHASAREIAERALGGTVLGGALAGAGVAAASSSGKEKEPVAASSTTAAPVSEAKEVPVATSSAPVKSESSIAKPSEPVAAAAAEPIDGGVVKKERSPFDPKTRPDNLAAPANMTPGDSRDVSPMSGARKDGDAPASASSAATAAAVAAASSPQTPTGTPQREKSTKRNSFFKNTPESQKAGTSSAPQSPAPSSTADGKPKKKGFLSKLKDKLKG